MKNIIQQTFITVFQREANGKALPTITDDLILLESGLDSLGFAILIVELEDEVGFDPFSIADEAFYPQTFGEFVDFYEKHKP